MEPNDCGRIEIAIRHLDPKDPGAGLTIRYGVAQSPFGECFVASLGTEICTLSFPQEGGFQAEVDALKKRWPDAIAVEEEPFAKALVTRIFDPDRRRDASPVKGVVRGTAFQGKVWKALVRIPPGRTTSYEEIADAIGAPRAVRAVGNAVGRNPLAFLIPCHRVLPKSGVLGKYRWGSAIKRAILAREGRTFE